ncbi:MAG TPA: hypothetical protein VKT81_08065 [Bryobacteraceae bacterium]|nr:hypothetical protein [Bryobacteraceae bacterium]
MLGRPTSQESIEALHKLRKQAAARGDECLSVILSGVELYTSLGREFDLIEIMKGFADEMRESVENTPTASQLEELFRRELPAETAERSPHSND